MSEQIKATISGKEIMNGDYIHKSLFDEKVKRITELEGKIKAVAYAPDDEDNPNFWIKTKSAQLAELYRMVEGV